MAPKTLDGSAFSFTTTRGHTTHISILWVFVLFSFLAVAVVLLGGYQEGLVERKLADTKISDKLEVQKALQVKGAGNPGFFSDMTTTPQTAIPDGANIALLKDVLLTISTNITNAAITISLPAATLGSRAGVVFGNFGPDSNLVSVSFTCTGNDQYQEGCVVPNGGYVNAAIGNPTYERSASGDTILTYQYNTIDESVGLVDRGSIFYFYCVREGFWQVFVKPNNGSQLAAALNQPADTLLFT